MYYVTIKTIDSSENEPACALHCLKVNASKTKFMRINATIDVEPIDDVESFCYLACIISKEPICVWKTGSRICGSSKSISMLLYGSE